MTSAEVVARYRDYAAKCLTAAKRRENERDRLAEIDMAQAWMVLARRPGREERRSSYCLARPYPTDDRAAPAAAIWAITLAICAVFIVSAMFH